MEAMCKHCPWFLEGQELMSKDGSLSNNLEGEGYTYLRQGACVPVCLDVYGKGKVSK